MSFANWIDMIWNRVGILMPKSFCHMDDYNENKVRWYSRWYSTYVTRVCNFSSAVNFLWIFYILIYNNCLFMGYHLFWCMDSCKKYTIQVICTHHQTHHWLYLSILFRSIHGINDIIWLCLLSPKLFHQPRLCKH